VVPGQEWPIGTVSSTTAATPITPRQLRRHERVKSLGGVADHGRS
jgi:hypothetical protein